VLKHSCLAFEISEMLIMTCRIRTRNSVLTGWQ